jgi:DNA-binding transcriptional LysR family regulator
MSITSNFFITSPATAASCPPSATSPTASSNPPSARKWPNSRNISELQGGQARHIRIGASAIVLRDHLPEVFRAARKKFPGLKLSLREGYPAQQEQLLQDDEIDLAFTLIERKMPAGVQSLTLLELPLVLLVEKSSGIKSAGELWKRDKIEEPLICLPQGESLCKNFQKKLAELGVDWFPAIEASSVDLVEAYVASGPGHRRLYRHPHEKPIVKSSRAVTGRLSSPHHRRHVAWTQNRAH